MKGPENQLESTFNEGMLQIQRLHELWLQANLASRKPKDKFFTEWRWTLDAIWRELSRDALKNESLDVEAETLTDSWEKNKWFVQYDMLKEEIKEKKNPEQVYEVLHRTDVFLRVLQQAVGKGGKFRDKDEDDLE